MPILLQAVSTPLLRLPTDNSFNFFKTYVKTPAAADNSPVPSVVVQAMAGTVGQDDLQVSLSTLPSQTVTAAPDYLPGYATSPLSPGESPSRVHRRNITQSASPVPAVVGIGRTSVMVSTAAAHWGRIEKKAETTCSSSK